MKSMKYSEKWNPIDEMGNVTMDDFDKRHPIDRSYKFETTLFNVKIRFVKYPALDSNLIKIFVTKYLKSFSFLPSFVKYNCSYDEVLTIEDAEKKYGISLDVKANDVAVNDDAFTKSVLETVSSSKVSENNLAEVVEQNLEHRAKKEAKVKVVKEKKVKTTPAVKKVKAVKEPVVEKEDSKLDVKPVKEKPIKKGKKKKSE